MKKVVTIFILLILFLFCSKWIIVYIDKNNINDIENSIIKNTIIKNIEYINKYDNYYIVMDSDYLYLINSKYEIVLEIDNDKIYKNKNDYELVYRNNTIMYMENYKNKKGLFFKYYDIYSYELIDEVLIGG